MEREIKIFENSDSKKLCDEVNRFLETYDDSEIVDIQYRVSNDYPSVMIIVKD